MSTHVVIQPVHNHCENEVHTNDVLRAVAVIQYLPSPMPPDGPFLRALGTTAALKAPPQTDNLAQRALEEWERTLCENKAVAILAEVQAGRPTIMHKDGGEMLIAIVLDKPLAEAKVGLWKMSTVESSGFDITL